MSNKLCFLSLWSTIESFFTLIRSPAIEEIKLDTLNIVDIEEELKFAKENLEIQAQELAKQNELLSKNQNIDTMKTDSKLIFTFEPLQYESILRDFEELKEKTGFKTNELVLIELLNYYIENNWFLKKSF